MSPVTTAAATTAATATTAPASAFHDLMKEGE
jgi:hypothetical protein